MGTDPAEQIGMTKARPLPGPCRLGIQANPVTATREIARELQIIAGRDPGDGLGERHHRTLSENPVTPGIRRQGCRQGSRQQLAFDVVEQNERRPTQQGRGNLLAKLFIACWRRHNRR